MSTLPQNSMLMTKHGESTCKPVRILPKVSSVGESSASGWILFMRRSSKEYNCFGTCGATAELDLELSDPEACRLTCILERRLRVACTYRQFAVCWHQQDMHM